MAAFPGPIWKGALFEAIWILMSPIRLPQTKILFSRRPYSRSAIDSLFKLSKSDPAASSWILTAEDSETTIFLFVLQNRPFTASQWSADRFHILNLRDFFRTLSSLDPCKLTLYLTNPIYFKCILVAIQKSPTIIGTTDLLNVEQLLNLIKASKKQVVATMKRSDELSLFFFLKGTLEEAFFVNRDSVTKEGAAEDQFLEYAYSGTAADPVTIQAFYDVNTDAAEDAELPWQEWPGGMVEYYLRSRPELVFLAGAASSDKQTILKSKFSMGRNPKSDMIINDTLASRDHAIIRELSGQFILEDKNSRNGTQINGKQISTAALSDGDEIQIGDYRIMFTHKSSATETKGTPILEFLESTAMKTDDMPGPSPLPPRATPLTGIPALILEMVKGKTAGKRYPLKKKTILGRSKTDINTDDPKTSRHHAAVERRDDGYYFTDLRSTNGSLLNGQEVRTKRLAAGDLITIGDSEFKVLEEDP